ncbi:MAG: hypothetical protein KDK71_08305, partial [Chlamydiia bacterium]|nr:hypothetical protein [Chlamydiia bacterium]
NDEASLKYEQGKLIVQVGSDAAPKLQLTLQADALKGEPLPDKLKEIINQLPAALFNGLPQKLLPGLKENATQADKVEKLLQTLKPLTAANWGVNLSAQDRGLEVAFSLVDGLTGTASLSLGENVVLDNNPMIKLAKELADASEVNVHTFFAQAERLKDINVTLGWVSNTLVITLESHGVTLNLTLDATEVLQSETLLPTLQAFAKNVGANIEPLNQHSNLLKTILQTGSSVVMWDGLALNAVFDVSDEVSCEARFIPSTNALSDLSKHPIVAKLMGPLTKKGELNGQDLKTLLSMANDAQTKMNWDGTKGAMKLEITLTDGSTLELTLSGKELFGPDAKTLPPVIQSLISKVPHGKALQTLFESLRPLLATNFSLDWDGNTGLFAVSFDEAQKVHINHIKGVPLGLLINFATGNTDFFLPKTINGTLDTSNLSLQVPGGLKLTRKGPIELLDVDAELYGVSYDVETKMLSIDIDFITRFTHEIPLGEQKKEEKKKEEENKPSKAVDISFFVGPQKV